MLKTVLHPTRRARPVAGAALIGAMSALTAASAAATPTVTQPEPKKAASPILVVDYAGAASLLVDKKDEALRNAIAMLPARFRELPGEVPDLQQVPPPVINLLLALLTQPARAAVTFDQDRQHDGMFGFGAVMSFGPGEQQAFTQMHGTVNALMAMAGNAGQGEVSAVYDQMLEIPSPVGGVIRYGPRSSKDGWRYEIHAGANADPDAVFGAVPAPFLPGMTPVARARFDLESVGPMLEQQLEAMGGEEGEQAAQMLTTAGLIGPGSLKYSWQTGYTKDEQISFKVVEGMRAHAADMGIPTSPLPDAAYAMIPADATLAGIFRADLKPMIGTLSAALEENPEAANGLDQFISATGVDPFADLLGCLGDTFGVYMSESTGGQLASCIAFVSLSDRPRFEQAHSKLVGFANTMLAQEEAAKGYAKVRSWADGDTQLFSLAFPGLPIPAEVTWALQGDWLVVGMMPQSTLAATRQIAGRGDKGLRTNAIFAAGLPAGKEIGSFMFIDSPRVMKDGYQYVALLGSAVANLARSRSSDREPGLVVPPLTELRKGARPIMSYSYWRGEDLVTESHSDRSMLVNMSGAIGAASPFIPLISMAAAAAASSGQQMNSGEFEGMFDQFLPLLP